MVLSVDQMQQLRTANPFLSEDDYIYADRMVTTETGLSTNTVFPIILQYTNTSLGVLQYALEEPDEVLLVGRAIKSGAIAPAANASTLLEAANQGSSKMITTVIVSNYSAMAQGISLRHLVLGGASVPPEADNIIFLPSPSVPVGTTPIRLNLMLRPGDQLNALSTAGSCSFVAYIQA